MTQGNEPSAHAEVRVDEHGREWTLLMADGEFVAIAHENGERSIARTVWDSWKPRPPKTKRKAAARQAAGDGDM